MGAKTAVTKIVIGEPNGSDLLRLLGDPPPEAGRKLGAPVNTDVFDVPGAMEEAARKVFLSRGRVEALRETLTEVYLRWSELAVAAGDLVPRRRGYRPALADHRSLSLAGGQGGYKSMIPPSVAAFDAVIATSCEDQRARAPHLTDHGGRLLEVRCIGAASV